MPYATAPNKNDISKFNPERLQFHKYFYEKL